MSTKSEMQGWFEAIKTAGEESENDSVDSERWELGRQVLDRAITRGGKPSGPKSEKAIAARYVLANSYELPETPSGIRPVVRKCKDSDRYVIGYEAYCVYCGEVWADPEYSWWGDIESAALLIEAGVDACVYEELEDGRVVCDADEKRKGCWKWCKCSDCSIKAIVVGDEAKIIGLDQADCKSEPWTDDEMDRMFG